MEKREQERLEEILAMCAQYEEQIDSEIKLNNGGTTPRADVPDPRVHSSKPVGIQSPQPPARKPVKELTVKTPSGHVSYEDRETKLNGYKEDTLMTKSMRSPVPGKLLCYRR